MESDFARYIKREYINPIVKFRNNLDFGPEYQTLWQKARDLYIQLKLGEVKEY